MTVSAFIAVSLDGYIAREDGNLDWLTAIPSVPAEEDYGYSQFIQNVDTVIMGRATFEKVLTFGDWPFEAKPVIVLSSNPMAIPAELIRKVTPMSGDPVELLRQLSNLGSHHVYIDGGQTIQRFLRAGLVNQLIITRLPVLIGSGIPLFGELDKDIPLRHVETRVFSNGYVQSRYAL